MENLFDCRTVGHRTENLLHSRLRVGAEERRPAVVLLDQDDPDYTTHHGICRQERLEGLGDFAAVKNELGLLPARAVCCAFGQADGLLAVGRFAPGLLGVAGARRQWQTPQGGILTQPADQHRA